MGEADMVEFEFEYALHSMGGIAEALDAAGIDDHVPTHGGSVERDAALDVRPAGIAWAARSAAAVAASAITGSVHGEPTPAGPGMLELDLRALPAPEPMVRALAAADALAPGATLLVWTPLLPTPLLQLLAERGLDAHAQCLSDGTARVAIRQRPAGRNAPGNADGQAGA
jgi:hypothetical protein